MLMPLMIMMPVGGLLPLVICCRRRRLFFLNPDAEFMPEAATQKQI